MSSKVTGWVWDQDIPIQPKCVLLWLAERATDNGVCFPGQQEIRRKTGLSESMVRRYLHALARRQDADNQPARPLLRIIERPIAGDRNTSNVYVVQVPWARPSDVRRELEELRHLPPSAVEDLGCVRAPQVTGRILCTPVGVAGEPQVGSTGDREETSLQNRHPEQSPPLPLSSMMEEQPQQQGTKRPRVAKVAESFTPSQRVDDDAAAVLATAFYRGLGASADSVTAAMLRRDLAIARQLVAVGATPQEAQAFAREMCGAAGRLAPIDLRSFERERLSWRARRRRPTAPETGFRLVTGMGLPD